jgi:tetratricopeptide (TPR) repeat protein
MDLTAGAGDGVLLELRAREAFTHRDYRNAAELAQKCAQQAATAGDQGTWWHMTFLQAECYRDLGEQEDSVATTNVLKAHSLTKASAELMCRVLTLASVSLLGMGTLAEALEDARAATTLGAQANLRTDVQIDAQSALVAALAESGRKDEAWDQCHDLVQLLAISTDSQLAGKGYWSVGNVAFFRQQPDEGVRFHKLAAEHLSPSNDLALWAWFNRASGAMRLSAGINDTETADCLDRAELAASIIGITDDVRRLNQMNRANWHFLQGEFSETIRLLTPLCAESDSMAHQTAGTAHSLLGKALRKQGECAEALRYLKISEAYFDQAGAKDRAAEVAAEIAGFPQAS